MRTIELLSSQHWVEAFGRTLLHSIWQDLLIAALYAGARRWVRSSTPDARYLLGCFALAAMMIAPLITIVLQSRNSVIVPALVDDRIPVMVQSVVGAGAPRSPMAEIDTAPTEPFLAWAVLFWFVGALTFSLRFVGGWIAAARMRFVQVRSAPLEWQPRFERLKSCVGVSGPVRLLISPLVHAPTVIGWLRPVILTPIASLTGLPVDQMEALLAHELAHLRRHDYLVNLLQGLAEILFFFHPAVWWVSGHIRTERELCCDDIAVAVCGDALTYARALAELESSRPGRFTAAVAANGGSLVNRIGRLLGQPRPESRRSGGLGIFASLLALSIVAFSVFGQTGTRPEFAVASIKPNKGPGLFMGVKQMSQGRMAAENTPLRFLIGVAYKRRAKWFDISGGPAWMNSDGYDIEARAEGNATNDQLLLMLQGLLKDRFQLQLHRETKILPVYFLTMAKSGLKLSNPKPGSCLAGAPQGSTTLKPGKAFLFPCGVVVQGLSPAGLRLSGGQTSTESLAVSLSGVLGRTVIDKTGFKGTFDIDLEFTRDDSLEGVPGRGMPGALPTPPPSGDTAGPSLFNALQEQLGLRLESGKGPGTVLVVDHVERPTPN